jgi:hypothetical protein
VGPLFQTILVKQFTRLRTGDRFFYLNECWGPDALAILQQGTTLAKVIEANTDVTNLQKDVFLFKASISGTVLFDFDHDGGHRRFFEPGIPGIKVQLEDAAGNILATTTTNLFGQYRFSQLSGPAANPDNSSGISARGYYQIVVTVPAKMHQTTPYPGPMQITVGDTNVFGVDFGLDFN